MLDKFTISEAFDVEITHAANGRKILLWDMNSFTQKLKAEFIGTTLKFNTKLEQLDLTYQIPGLATVPVPNISELDTRSERATALLQHWENYPSIGLGVFTAMQGGFWIKAGESILQNHGMENWINVLSPVLTTSNEVLLLGERSRIAVEVLDTGNGLLKPGDKLTIRGTISSEIAVWEKELDVVRSRRIDSIVLPDGIATQIVAYNSSRKYLYVTNVGSVPIQFIFGTAVELSQNSVTENNRIVSSDGLLLSPSGSANFVMDRHIEPSPVSAVAIGGDSRITSIEGW